LSVLAVVMANGSMNLSEVAAAQKSSLGIVGWNILSYPFLIPAFVIYFLASLAECNRGPFDLPEAESELVGGFHTEYSGLRWAFLFLAEYGMMLLTSLLATILFLGAWHSPLPNVGPVALSDWTSGGGQGWYQALWGAFWLLSKTVGLVFIQIMARWTYPRLRADQLMNLCWKVLTPIALLVLVLAGLWKVWL
jgi:NADH-quinone oxidoreductase subunit H